MAKLFSCSILTFILIVLEFEQWIQNLSTNLFMCILNCMILNINLVKIICNVYDTVKHQLIKLTKCELNSHRGFHTIFVFVNYLLLFFYCIINYF